MKKLFKFLVAVFMGLALTSCGKLIIQPVLSGVELNKDAITLEVGQAETLQATIKPELLDEKTTTITWSTSNNAVASVSDKGLVTALKEGTATVKVTVTSGRFTKEDTCLVTVVQPVSSVTLDKTNASLKVGDNVKLTPTVLPNNATNKAVTWATSDANVATVNDGLVRAIKSGSAIITVTTVDGNKTSSCTVTVFQPVSGVVLDKQAHTLNVGENFTLNATLNPNDADNKEVTWSSSNTAVATVNNGKVTALKAGTTTITVKTADGNKEASCVVTVLQPVTGVTLDSSELALVVGEDTTLVATVLPSDASNKAVTWTTSDASVATVNNEGKVVAVGPGSAVITVKTTDGNKTSSCIVTVTQLVTGVTLDKEEASVETNKTTTLVATVLPANASNKDVVWTSSDKLIATVENGVVKGIAPGTAIITVTTVDGSFKDTCTVTVIERVTSVTLQEKLNLVEGSNPVKLTPTVLPANASNKAVTWSSSNTQVVTVDAEGNVTPVGLGTAVITVTTVDGSLKDTCTVTVVEFTLPATGVEIEGSKDTLLIDETLLLEAVVTPEETTDVAIWSSSNENVATVGQNGSVTALAAGTTTIKVKYGAVEATYDITVVKHTATVEGFEEKAVVYGNDYSFDYTVSSNQEASVEYYKGETKLASKPTNAGEYSVKLTLAENAKYYALTKTVKLTINQKEVSEPTVSGSYTYSGSIQTVTLVGLESYMSVAGNKATNAGSYEVVITLDNNHKWAQGNDGVVAWSIAKANASLSVEDLEVELGAEIKVNYETSSNGQVTIKFYQNNVEVTPDATGEYKVVVSVAEGSNHKAVEAEATLNIILSATSVELSKDSTTINVGENETIEIKVNPVGTTDEVVITSSNNAVATMDKNGKIVAKTTTGTTTITVTCGDYSDSIVVTVVNPWGTENDPITVEEAIELLDRYTKVTYSPVKGYIEGVVASKPSYNSKYSSYTFNLVENNSKVEFVVYSANLANGVNEPVVGDIVLVSGWFVNYSETKYEIANSGNTYPTIISVEKPKFDIELSIKDTNGNDTTSVTVVDLEEKAEVNAKVEFTIENEQDLILIVTVNDVELTPVDGTYSFTITEATSVNVIVVEGDVNAESITIEGETTVELDQKTLTLVGTTVPYYATEAKTWTSSDESIATVENGVVTLKKAGTVTITVKTGTTNKEDTHEITITNRWGTLENPISVETAIELIGSEITANNTPSSVQGYLKGIVKTEATLSGADYSMYLEAGNNSFQLRYVSLQEGQLVPSIGDEVVVYGYFTKYNATYQMSNISGYGRPNIISVAHKEYSYTVEYLDTEDAVFEGAEIVGLGTKLTSGSESVFTVNVPQGYEVNKVKFNGVTITPNAEGEYTIVTALENVITVIVIEEGAEVPEPTTTTVTTKIADYAAAHSWKDSTAYNTVEMNDNITVTAKPTTGTNKNTGKYYNNGNNWRMYQNENPEIIISAKEGNIVSVKITYANKNNGSLTLNNKNIASNTVVEINDSSVQFSVGNTGTATNGNIQITNIEVVYSLSEVSTPTCEHTNTTTTTVEATCTQKGSTTVTCVDCSEVISTTEIPAKGHTYVDGVCSCGEQEPQEKWTLVTDVNDLAAGDKVVIVAKDSDYALSTNQKSSNRGAAPITKDGETITFGDDVQVIILKEGESSDRFAFYTGDAGYLYAASSSGNQLKTKTKLDEHGSWQITISSDGTASIVAKESGNRNVMQYNPNNGSPLFACYASDSQKAVCIYKLG